MYTINAVKGDLKLDLSAFFMDVNNTIQAANETAIKTAKVRQLFDGLVKDYKSSLEDALKEIGASAIKLKLHETWNGKLASSLTFGHGRANVSIDFKQSDEGDFVGEVSYHGMGTFAKRSTKVESVAQVIEFLEAPIKLLLIDNLAVQFSVKQQLEQGVIDVEFRK